MMKERGFGDWMYRRGGIETVSKTDFSVFKSNICHRVKDMGDLDFIISVLESDEIRRYDEKHWYAESLYLLAMVDYLSRINGLPICNAYDDLRSRRLSKPLYPMGALLADDILKSKAYREECYACAIPEFLRFNIVEGDIRNVA